MKTIIIELRYQSEPEKFERHSGLVDGINDIVLELAYRFDLDVLSISHVLDDALRQNHTGITCTAVCQVNRIAVETIGEMADEENEPGGNLHCFLERPNKLSVRVSGINYN
ncbi:MAG TPA: hypothetical protein VFV38_08840 [Ktedonobacteraceae bacterium]|nr:hypothetical protein [Ktedonobacteraceae bacterium]